MHDNPEIYEEIAKERDRQTQMWGDQEHSPETWARILGEEYGEVCRAINESDSENLKTELIQTAAVCIAALRDLTRN